jgi:glycosyltransferase involved in cell wall biosynthesis
MQKPDLSAILITRDAALQLPDCLKTIDFCAEIVVVDNGSIDSTVSIAKDFGCKVIQTTEWPGFGVQKQRALDQARGSWILSIDADERVSQELRDEIALAIQSHHFQGYFINRKTQFLGRWMMHGGWYPDYVLRLARRDSCYFDPAPVHERLIVRGSTSKLSGQLLHFSYQDIDDVLSKQRRYALAGAEKIRALRGSSVSIFVALLRAFWAFSRSFFFRLGFLDGRQGLLAALAKSQEVFWKYVAIEFQTKD